jgi:hypothetical protein
VLQLAQVLPLDVRLAGRRHQALLRLGLGRAGRAVVPLVVDDDPQAPAHLLQPGDDLGFVQVVGHHRDLGLRAQGLVEDLENGLPCLEAHPGQGLPGLGVRGLELEPGGGTGREELRDVSRGLVPVDEGLGGDEAPGEGDVQLPGVRLAAELERGLLGLTRLERLLRVHEHRRHPVGEGAGQLGVPREVDPAELWMGDSRVDSVAGSRSRRHRETDPVLQSKELRPAGLAVLDAEA